MVSLFTPVKIGNIELKHRIALAPLTRNRADDNNVPLPIVKEYYEQRASVPGTLLITEGTFISKRAGGFENVPGIYNQAQISAWKEVTDAVHAKGGFIFCQLWALGRAADPSILAKSGHDVVSSGNIPMSPTSPIPKSLDESQIQAFIEDYVVAAKNAMRAGFDGVEIHGANGYLCDQFLQDTCNNRNDRWGGSISNRARFGTEVAKAIAAAIGAERTGYRMSPWSPFQGMKMKNPEPQFTELVKNLREVGLAYIHIIESRISGPENIAAGPEQPDVLLDAWGNSGAVVLAGGFTPDSAEATIQKYPHARIIVAFGRHYLANPDLPFRIAQGLGLNQYNRKTFYIPKDPVGYLDYPYSPQYQAQQSTSG